MIAIYNKGPTSPEEADDIGGERLYHLHINESFICFFTHRRIDGLAECLRKAASAVDDLARGVKL